MNRRHDILCISTIDWDFIWQGHQEIMSRLAADGHRVLFIENTGVRAPRVRDLGRVRHRLQNWWRGTKGFREERPNLFVHSPLVLPLPYSRIAGWINRLVIMRSLTRTPPHWPRPWARSSLTLPTRHGWAPPGAPSKNAIPLNESPNCGSPPTTRSLRTDE